MIHGMRTFFSALCFGAVLCFYSTSFGQDIALKEAVQWADSLMKTMSPAQRTAQLFMVAAYSKHGTQPTGQVERLVVEQGVGGLIFMQGGPGRQLLQTNRLQEKAKVPLLLSIDGEWGLAMRLDSTMAFPYQMTLGAIQDESLIRDMGRIIGSQCRRIGLTMNMAPVIDVNNNPANPVINARSFGDRPLRVGQLGAAYASGMQDRKVLACAKHFPGHGDTDADSHHTLPSVNQSRERLDSVELAPYQQLIDAQVAAIMVAHLSVPALEPQSHLPTTLSYKVVGDLLKKQMNYSGLVVTDALNMKGVSNSLPPGEVDAEALIAGNDVLLFSGDVPKAIAAIHQAILDGRISRQEVDARCRKILIYKYLVGLHQWKALSIKNLEKDLFHPEAIRLRRNLYRNALTLLTNRNQLLPLQSLDTLRPVLVQLGKVEGSEFSKRLQAYADMPVISVSESPDASEKTKLWSRLKSHNLVILSMHRPGEKPFRTKRWAKATQTFVGELLSYKPGILVHFAQPYALAHFDEVLRAQAIVQAYEDVPDARDYAAQLIFGGIPAQGKLPVAIPGLFSSGIGLSTPAGFRMEYTLPEDAGFDGKRLEALDSLLQKAIRDKAFPGCQVLAARGGKVFLNKSYGYHTYQKEREVQNHHLYDLASITKIAGTLPQVMWLTGKGNWSIDDPLGKFLPELKGTDKFTVSTRDLLTHQAGFKPWIPFHNATLTNGKPDSNYYRTQAEPGFELQVAEGLFARNDLPDSIFLRNIQTPLQASKRYLYSDLGYYYLQRIIERYRKARLDALAEQDFFKPLGAWRAVYNPLQRFPKEEIVPTEDDMLYRGQLIHGYVHDQGASLMGGVAGHAGLFSNANDLAKLVQMFLNQGMYGGKVYLDAEVIQEFAKCQFCANGNRRGVGFDKKHPNGRGGTACDCVSFLSFGHSGFTGTLVWADPEYNILFVFLSNRVHPSAENRLIIQEDIRAKAQGIIYDAMDSYPPRY